MLINCATASILIQAMSAVALWFWFGIIINIHSWTRWNIQSNQICIPKGNFYYIRKYDFSFRISSQMFLIIPNVIPNICLVQNGFFCLFQGFLPCWIRTPLRWVWTLPIRKYSRPGMKYPDCRYSLFSYLSNKCHK